MSGYPEYEYMVLSDSEYHLLVKARIADQSGCGSTECAECRNMLGNLRLDGQSFSETRPSSEDLPLIVPRRQIVDLSSVQEHNNIAKNANN